MKCIGERFRYTSDGASDAHPRMRARWQIHSGKYIHWHSCCLKLTMSAAVLGSSSDTC